MMAMAKAPGSSAADLSNDGPTGVGSPDGTVAMRATPCSSSEAKATRAMPPPRRRAAPGTCRGEPAEAEEHGEGGAEKATVVS